VIRVPLHWSPPSDVFIDAVVSTITAMFQGEFCPPAMAASAVYDTFICFMPTSPPNHKGIVAVCVTDIAL
jgi:hypothetical protein